jgi:hypothetical protein
MPAVVQVPTTVEQLDQVRSLMRAFIVWHKARHREDIRLIDAYFDAGAFEQELAGTVLAAAGAVQQVVGVGPSGGGHRLTSPD